MNLLAINQLNVQSVGYMPDVNNYNIISMMNDHIMRLLIATLFQTTEPAKEQVTIALQSISIVLEDILHSL